MKPTRLLAAIILAALVMSRPGAAAGDELVGYVVSMESGSKAIVVSAVGKRPLRLGDNILAGDRVEAVGPVTIDTVSGAVTLCEAGEPRPCARTFSSDGGNLTPSGLSKRLSRVLSWFSAPSRDFVTRSAEPPSIAAGRGGPQRLVAGQRTLWLAWQNGAAPFRIMVGAAVSDDSGRLAEGNEIAIPSIDLPPGETRIRIVDAQGREAVLPVRVVAHQPTRPDLRRSAVNPDHEALLGLIALATSEDGAWSLEAASRAHELARRVPAAATLARALAAGDRL